MSARVKLGAASLSAALAGAVLAVGAPSAGAQEGYGPVVPGGTASPEVSEDPDDEDPDDGGSQDEDGEVDGGDSDDGDDDDGDGDPDDEDEDDGPDLTVSRSVARPGDVLTISATDGCEPGSTVVVSLLNVTEESAPVELARTTADQTGAFATTAEVPQGAEPGVYIVFVRCFLQASEDAKISTVPFIVNESGTTPDGGESEQVTSSVRAAGTSSTRSTSVRELGLTSADVPATWTPPAQWEVSETERAEVVQAVNLRLAALRTELAATPASVATPTDLTPWYAAAGVTFVALGAAGYRRRTVVGRRGDAA